MRENYLLLIALYCWLHSGLLYYTGFFKAPENARKVVDYFTHQTLCCYVLLQSQLYTLLTIFCSFTVTLVFFFPPSPLKPPHASAPREDIPYHK